MYLQISRTIKSPIALGTRIPWAIVWAFFSITLSLFPSWNAFYKELHYNNKMRKDKQNVCKKEKLLTLTIGGHPRACTATILGSGPLIHPISNNSSNAYYNLRRRQQSNEEKKRKSQNEKEGRTTLYIPMRPTPPPVGYKMTLGSSH